MVNKTTINLVRLCSLGMQPKAKTTTKGGTIFERGLPSEVRPETVKLLIDSMAGMAVTKLTPLFLSSYLCLLYMFTY